MFTFFFVCLGVWLFFEIFILILKLTFGILKVLFALIGIFFLPAVVIACFAAGLAIPVLIGAGIAALCGVFRHKQIS